MADKVNTKTWVSVKLLVGLGAALIIAAASIIATLLGNAPPPPETETLIINPEDGATVNRAFRVKGKTISIANDEHLWLAVEIGKLIWIKEPKIRGSDRNWNVEIVEGGNPPEGKFALLLIKVKKEGQEYITAWINKCKSTGDCPGIIIDDIPGAAVLERVEDLKLK